MLAEETHKNNNRDKTFQPDSYIRVKSTGCYRQKMALQCSVKHFSLTLTSESSQQDGSGKKWFYNALHDRLHQDTAEKCIKSADQYLAAGLYLQCSASSTMPRVVPQTQNSKLKTTSTAS